VCSPALDWLSLGFRILHWICFKLTVKLFCPVFIFYFSLCLLFNAVVLITMIMDMDSVKRHTIPTGKRTGLTRDTRHLQRGPRRASTETSPMADTDCTVWCCEIASLHQSCVLFKEMSAILGSRRNWLCPRSKQRWVPFVPIIVTCYGRWRQFNAYLKSHGKYPTLVPITSTSDYGKLTPPVRAEAPWIQTSQTQPALLVPRTMSQQLMLGLPSSAKIEAPSITWKKCPNY